MRLLNSQTGALEDFIGTSPPYAILSHTWEEEEVVFGDLNNPGIDHTAKKGWYKIKKACEQARQDCLDYLWADTLCIDKSSSAELSEAINSMYRWYGASSICYAYLSDIPKKTFQDSRWFSRGWTLQELIAPSELRFYDGAWNEVGTKAAFLDTLHEITGIETSVLRGAGLRFIGVATKMSWASKRQTTREEDLAYCLLGLFGISMPLIYGEGPKAFLRLQEAIIREYDDDSILAWRAAGDPKKYGGLLARSPADFASSSNIMPWRTRKSYREGVEPITVTSRGLIIKRTLRPAPHLGDGVFLLPLYCKYAEFDMNPSERLAVSLWGQLSFGGVYARVLPDRLHRIYPDEGPVVDTGGTVYGLTENRTPEFEPTAGFGLWVRTMPRWPGGRRYRLALASPAESWDPTNNMFHGLQDDAVNELRTLVFQDESPGTARSCFVVFLRAENDPVRNHYVKRRLRCNVVFGRWEALGPEALADLAGSLAPSAKIADAEGDGVVLRCYAKHESVFGQPLYCADLYVKETAAAS